MLLTLTWCHRTPTDTPTRVSTIRVISDEQKLDNVTCACYVGRQGGAIRGGAAAFLHQSCPIAVHDCQVVGAIMVKGMDILYVKCSEL